MQSEEKGNSFGHLAVLAGLWFINILILIFGLPFLIYKKVKTTLFKPAKKPQRAEKSKSAQYLPYGIDSKL
jgi:hypothetical protein